MGNTGAIEGSADTLTGGLRCRLCCRDIKRITFSCKIWLYYFELLCHCDTCGQTDRHNVASTGLRNFFPNLHNKKWIEGRHRECNEVKLTYINVQQYNWPTLMYRSTTELHLGPKIRTCWQWDDFRDSNVYFTFLMKSAVPNFIKVRKINSLILNHM